MLVTFLKRKEISNQDIILNLNPNTVAIILTDDLYYIEILENGEFYVSDGWEGKKTNNILEAIEFLNVVIMENN